MQVFMPPLHGEALLSKRCPDRGASTSRVNERGDGTPAERGRGVMYEIKTTSPNPRADDVELIRFYWRTVEICNSIEIRCALCVFKLMSW